MENLTKPKPGSGAIKLNENPFNIPFVKVRPSSKVSLTFMAPGPVIKHKKRIVYLLNLLC